MEFGKGDDEMTRTPDEIKKGLSVCMGYTEGCAICPYYHDKECQRDIKTDALSYIQQLEAQNAELLEKVEQLQAERDAAVADMRQASIYLCCACKKYHHAVCGVSNHYCEEIGERPDFTGAMSCGMFEWRGVQKEE